MTRKLWILVSVFVMAGLMISVTPAVFAGTTIVLKAGSASDPTHHYNLGIVKFGEIVAQKSGGRIKVELYHSGQLGNERDLLEGLTLGTVHLVAIATAPAYGWVPKIGVIDLPYLFTTREQAFRVLDGPIGQGFFKELEAKDVIGLGYFDNGWRHMTNNKRPIYLPADVRGMKIRVMESPVPINTFNTIGAIATPMAVGEVYTALMQGTVDGHENTIIAIYTQKMYEVQKYLSLTGHFYAAGLFAMSKAMFTKLSPEDREIVREAAKEATTYERQMGEQLSREFLVKIREKGMLINEVPNKKAWQDAMSPVYAKFEGQFGKDLIETIRNTK